nr:unnamed protein product [Digitaria exilis]
MKNNTDTECMQPTNQEESQPSRYCERMSNCSGAAAASPVDFRFSAAAAALRRLASPVPHRLWLEQLPRRRGRLLLLLPHGGRRRQ